MESLATAKSASYALRSLRTAKAVMIRSGLRGLRLALRRRLVQLVGTAVREWEFNMKAASLRCEQNVINVTTIQLYA